MRKLQISEKEDKLIDEHFRIISDLDLFLKENYIKIILTTCDDTIWAFEKKIT